MSLLDQLLRVMTPHDCLGCGREGDVLCADCQTNLPALPSRCYRCRSLTENARVCQSCRKQSRLFAVRVATIYDTTAKDLVWKLKFAGAQEAAIIMARQMSQSLNVTVEDLCIVPVPTASSRVRRRGYDQTRLLARGLARQTGLGYQNCLRRLGQSHQVGASRLRRLQQLQGAFRLKRGVDLRGLHILLVDDVVTTGATLEAAARVCRAAGAARVEAVVFAQA